MKLAQKQIFSFLSLVSMALLLSACNPGDKSSTRSSTYYNPNYPGVGINTNNMGANCGAGQATYGRVYDPTGYGNNFEYNVKDLVSAGENPNILGSIEGGANANTGVLMQLTVRANAASVIVEQTKLKLSIWDSNVGQLDSSGKQIKAYDITFDRASAGSLQANGKMVLTFKDKYGEVTLDGNLNQQSFSGQVSFRNYTSWDGSSPASGSLGAFTISRCAIGL